MKNKVNDCDGKLEYCVISPEGTTHADVYHASQLKPEHHDCAIVDATTTPEVRIPF